MSGIPFEPGDLVLHPTQSDWGIGQVQSVVDAKITVNFEHVGKIVMNANVVSRVHYSS